MRRLLIFFGLIMSATILFAQESDGDHVLTKKEKRIAEAKKNSQITKSILESKQFVLETDYLQNKWGERIPVNSTINFVAVDLTEAAIQIGSNFTVGPNGVGGVTARGNITKFELSEDQKHMTFTLSIHVMTSVGMYDMFVNIGSSGRGTATLTGMHSGKLLFEGNVVPLRKSATFEGSHL